MLEEPLKTLNKKPKPRPKVEPKLEFLISFVNLLISRVQVFFWKYVKSFSEKLFLKELLKDCFCCLKLKKLNQVCGVINY